MSDRRVIWFRNDLRVHDHAALAAACAAGDPVLPLYIFEPEAWARPHASSRQWDFVMACLTDLDAELWRRGARLHLAIGSATAVLTRLHAELGLRAVHAHQVFGSAWDQARDRTVRAWSQRAGVPFLEHAECGETWSDAACSARVRAPTRLQGPPVPGAPWPDAERFDLAGEPCRARLPGGRRPAVERLNAAAEDASVTPDDALAVLEADLAYGALSLREVCQAIGGRRGESPCEAARLDAMTQRLRARWRTLQRVNDMPAIEKRDADPACDGLRDHPEADDPKLRAWIEGRTGFPIVDASLRAVSAAGILSAPKRALVISCAANLLWMHWKRPADALASRLLGIEPAVFYVQAAAAAREASDPVVEAETLDPDGAFVRKWLPELAGLSVDEARAPWRVDRKRLSAAGVTLGATYPAPIVDPADALRFACQRIDAARRGEGRKRSNAVVREKHGARRIPVAKGRRKAAPAAAPASQLSLDLPDRPS
ncbi:MAG: FAD-binding domain-containing protein [Pseudomonadota bacterium]